MGLNDHFEVSITADSAGASRPSYGVPLIVSATASWPERARVYSGIAGVEDDFAEDSPEVLGAGKIFAQRPRPKQVVIGRLANKPTLQYTLDCSSVSNSYTYRMNVKGEGVTATEASYASDSAATQAEVHAGVVAALNAVVGKNYTAAFAALVNADDTFVAEADDDTATAVAHGLLTGDGPFQVSNSGGALPSGISAATDYWIIRTGADTFKFATSLANALAGTAVDLTTDGTGTQTLSDTISTVRPDSPFTVTADVAGEWFSLELLNDGGQSVVDDWDMAMTHADPGLAADLTAITNAQPGWYQLHMHFPSDAMVKAAALWIETHKRTYIALSHDTEAIKETSDGTQGTLDDLKTLGYARTMTMYHHAPDQMASAGWSGRVLPIDPGGIVYAYKTLLGGIAATPMTDTQRANLDARNANYYKTEANLNFTWKGKACDGHYFDVVRDLDWYENELQTAELELFVDNNKIPGTNPGILQVVNRMRGVTDLAIRRGVLTNDPAPEFSYPDASERSDADKAARHLGDLVISATLANAIQTGAVNITISN